MLLRTGGFDAAYAELPRRHLPAHARDRGRLSPTPRSTCSTSGPATPRTSSSSRNREPTRSGTSSSSHRPSAAAGINATRTRDPRARAARRAAALDATGLTDRVRSRLAGRGRRAEALDGRSAARPTMLRSALRDLRYGRPLGGTIRTRYEHLGAYHVDQLADYEDLDARLRRRRDRAGRRDRRRRLRQGPLAQLVPRPLSRPTRSSGSSSTPSICARHGEAAPAPRATSRSSAATPRSCIPPDGHGLLPLQPVRRDRDGALRGRRCSSGASPRRSSTTTRSTSSAFAGDPRFTVRELDDPGLSSPLGGDDAALSPVRRRRSRITPHASANATDETSTAAPAPVTPHFSPRTTISGSITAVSTPCAHSRRPGPADRDGERLRPAEDELDRGRDEDQPRRRDRRRGSRRRARAGRATGSSAQHRDEGERGDQRRSLHVAADPRDARPRGGRAPSRGSARRAGSSAAARRARASPVCGICAARNKPDLGERPDDPERERCDPQSAARSARCRRRSAPTKRMIGPRSSPIGTGSAGREAAQAARTRSRGSRSSSSPARRRRRPPPRSRRSARRSTIPASRSPIESVSQVPRRS